MADVPERRTKAVNITGKIIKLQNLDSRIIQIRREIKLCESKKGQYPEVTEQRRQSEILAAQVQELEKQIASDTAQDDELHKKAEKLHTRLYGGGVISPKELRDMETELEQTKQRADDLSELILVNMDRLEELRRQSQELSRKLEVSERNARQEDARLQRAVKHGQEEAAKLLKERVQLTADLDKQTLYDYTNLFKSKKGLAAVETSGSTCGGCKAQISAYKLIELRNGDKISFCETCGRILIMRCFAKTE